MGILGTESTHAEAFAALIQRIPERAAVTAVLEEGDGAGERLADRYGIAHVCRTVEELVAHVDAAMLCHRRSGQHMQPARELLNAGKAVWIDKPVTEDVQQLKALVELARRRGVVLDGGSTCRYCRDVQTLAGEFRRLKQAGRVLAGGLNYMGHPDSEYDGVMFYGPHAMTLLGDVFGRDACSMLALRQGQSLIALARYPDFAVAVQMADCQTSYGEIYQPDDVLRVRFGMQEIYAGGLEHFLGAIERNAPVDGEALLSPVAYLSALRNSLRSGQEEKILR